MDVNVLYKRFMQDPEFAKMYWDSLEEIKQEVGLSNIPTLKDFPKQQEKTQSLNTTNKNKSVKNMKNKRLRPVMEAGPHAEQMAKNRYNELQDRYKKLEDEYDSCNNASREIELQIEMAELSDEIEQLKKDWGYALDLNESINIREYLNDLDKEDYRDLVNMYESSNLTPKNKLKILEAIKSRDDSKVVKLVELYYNGIEDSDSFIRFTLDEDSKR